MIEFDDLTFINLIDYKLLGRIISGNLPRSMFGK